MEAVLSMRFRKAHRSVFTLCKRGAKQCAIQALQQKTPSQCSLNRLNRAISQCLDFSYVVEVWKKKSVIYK
jgi:hypothetical protein